MTQGQVFVEADMQYIVDDGVPPVMYIDWPEEEHKAHPPTYENQRVKIENGRPRQAEYSLHREEDTVTAGKATTG